MLTIKVQEFDTLLDEKLEAEEALRLKDVQLLDDTKTVDQQDKLIAQLQEEIDKEQEAVN